VLTPAGLSLAGLGCWFRLGWDWLGGGVDSGLAGVLIPVWAGMQSLAGLGC